ncbi:hypothetical protein Tco_1279992 [Tanacetum coccineum]
MSSLWSTGDGTNNDAGSGGDGNGDDVGTGGGKYSDDGRGGNGGDGCSGCDDDGSAGAAKHLARRFSIEGGDSELSGDGGGGGKARSLSTFSSDEKCIGTSGRIDILAVVRYVSGDGGVATDSSVSNGFVSSEEGAWSTTGAITKSAGARCSSSYSEASSSSSSSSEESSSSPSPPSAV